LRDLPRAQQCCTEALAVNDEQGHRKAKAPTLDSLGYICAQRHDYGTAAILDALNHRAPRGP
jgi:hypothetical protein